MHTNDLNFIPIDREIKLDSERMMICKFTPDGLIEYVNDYYVEVTGYEVHEIVGNSIETFKHPDFPLTVYNYMMHHVNEGINVNIVLKDQSKDGRYYWFFTDFEFKKNDEGAITSFFNRRIAAPRMILPEIELLYQKLLKIEQHSGAEVAQNYFDGYNEDNGMSFNEYTQALILNYESIANGIPKKTPIEQNKPIETQSFFSKVFGK